MSQLGVILQESLRREREERTILGLLTEHMDSVNRDDNNDGEPRRRRSLKERLRFTGMGCCGATWGFRPTTVRDEGGGEDEDERRQQQQRLQEQNPGQRSSSADPDCLSPNPSGSGMNLAAALAAERQFRGSQEAAETGRQGVMGNNFRRGSAGAAPGTPWRVSLMRLLEESEGGEAEVTGKVTENGEGGNDTVCCVCMGRKKGAAFIPCGHTFCRVCSRELWLNRGTCPLCNRSILEILDIF
ncbi:uncharacterized protein LOC129286609 isoform X1 [Prosopis cineraria]|uniref:uncharacterized protein LOC129286609 isoform X1 n=2 Tax=Prosopis cineraria TaxID=364024 RepID=UPI00240F112F|nr:uncharacterized protein LOC129286609 isoform X1 [Prosopis cineraria]